MEGTISIIWVVFTVIFAYLGFSHWIISEKTTPPFELPKRTTAVNVEISIGGSDLDQPIKDFTLAVNSSLKEQDKLASKQNKIAATGYWAAALTALFSLLLGYIDLT